MYRIVPTGTVFKLSGNVSKKSGKESVRDCRRNVYSSVGLCTFLVANGKSYEKKDVGIGGCDDDATVAADTSARIFESDRNIERAHPFMVISYSGICTHTHTPIYTRE